LLNNNFIVLKKINLSILILLTFFSFGSLAQIQCTTDVTINEGNSITVCEGDGTSISAASGFVSYAWTGPSTESTQSITPPTSGQYIVAGIDAVGCISTDTIQVAVNITPTANIISSEGAIICPTTGTTLSTDVSFSSYDWGNGNLDPTFSVYSPGNYSVNFIDGKGCSGSANIIITSPSFTLTSSELSACGGTGISLQATGGTSYAWSTGEFGNSIVVDPSVTTNYSVAITAGSCVENLLLQVEPVEPLDYYLEDTIYIHANDNVFLNGPPGFSTYSWSPTNQIDNPQSQGVVFSGTESQDITVVATHSSGCTLTATTTVIVVELTIPNGFSPNGDDFNQTFVIPEIITENYKAKVSIWNRWGELVLDDPNYLNTWEGKCETDLCLGNQNLPEGTYFYNIDINDITFKGYVTIKR